MNTESTLTAADLADLAGDGPQSAARAKPALAKPYRAETHAAFVSYRDGLGLSLGALASELGVAASAVSKYINKKPEGDVAALEVRIEDLLRSAPQRVETRQTLFETNVTRAVAACCEIIRKTNVVGLVHGAAGIGKSSGADLYCAANASAVRVSLAPWSGTAGGIEAALFSVLETRGKKRGERRAAWMAERLKGSSRLIVVDNAHLLTSRGIAWLFYFHRETGCPVAMLGNPEILNRIERNDQHFSCVGYDRAVELKRPADAAQAMLAALCPDHADDLAHMAATVAAKRGHLRSLRMHIHLMREMLPSVGGHVQEAFKLANSQLVTSYTL